MTDGDWARQAAGELLRPLGDRWDHVQAVAMQAEEVGRSFPTSQRALLVEAAWLHDIGYAPELRVTGFHPIDGASWLVAHNRELHARLVAHHSCAYAEAGLRGLGSQLEAFHEGPPRVADALTYCDMTSGPTGERVTLGLRIQEIHERYGPGHVVSRAIEQATVCLASSVARTEALIAASSPG